MHAHVVAEECLTDIAVEQVRAEEIESLWFLPEGFGVHDAVAFGGLVQQAEEVLRHYQILPRHVRADDHHVQAVPFLWAQVLSPGRDLGVGGIQLRTVASVTFSITSGAMPRVNAISEAVRNCAWRPHRRGKPGMAATMRF